MPDALNPSEFAASLVCLARVVGVTRDYADAAERAGEQLAADHLPAEDLDRVAQMVDAAYNVAAHAATTYAGLVMRHMRIAGAVAAAGGAARRMSWYGR
jgi:hypothetical protein